SCGQRRNADIPYSFLVIPANAGIQVHVCATDAMSKLDSRVRGNDEKRIGDVGVSTLPAA
ncbi:MAG: hypothetical protein KKB61_11295, partial [Alphaproteobacteria bacterium]|nr:hypothetical protein [Alphaproteobacteria bacterium]